MKRVSNYNDGYIRVYKEIPVKTNFGAKENIKTRIILNLLLS